RLAAFDGGIGLVWALRGKPKVAFRFTVTGGRVTAIDMIGDEAWLESLEIYYLRD
ncbi:MAG: RNA polymerase subunit sigma-70, partial [Dermatophilaceae bacterium]|nr:RNA polymerase subunit sigma-70 [Dermatophilaceae bacterium]